MLVRKNVAVLALAVMVLASCGAPAPAGQSATPTQSTTRSVTIVVSGEPPTLDGLHESNTLTFNTITQNINETLATIDTETRKVVPVLATAWKSTGATTWEITLRSGVKFHDGSAMTADDVTASLGYVLQQGSAFASYLPYASSRKINDSTIEITTTRADPLLPVQLQFISVARAADIAKGKDFMATGAVGTGPYKLVNWTKGQSLTLTRFDGYWGTAPVVKDVTFVWRTESSVRANMVKTGEAQLALALSPSDLQGLPKVETIGGLAVYTLFFNTTGQTKGSIMMDERLRKAVLYAIDKKALKDQIYGGYATLVGGNVVPKVVLGHNEKIEDYAYDPAKAKGLVTDAGATGKQVSFLCPSERYINAKEACQLITAQLTQIGLSVNLNVVPYAVWLDTYRNGPKGLDRPDIMLGGPGDETLDMASKVAPTYFRSAKAGGGGGAIDDPQLEAMVAAAAAEADQTKRQQLEEQMSKYVFDHAYMGPLLEPNSNWGLAKDVDFKPLSTEVLFLSRIRFI